MNKRTEKERGGLVVKSNDLIQKSRYSLSVQEQKIILYIISKISPNDSDSKLYDFHISDFCKVCGIDYLNGGNYDALKESIKKLSDKSIWIRLPDGKRETLVRWIEKPYIQPGDGLIQVKLDKDMMPYLLRLRDNFTSYELSYILLMRSKYSVRLYELLKSRHYDKLSAYTYTIHLDELRERIDATSETYDNFKDFRRAVLEKALNEINKFTDIDVSYSSIKRGKRVYEIEFIICPKDACRRLQAHSLLEEKGHA